MNIERSVSTQSISVKGAFCLRQGFAFRPLQLRELTTRYTDYIVDWRNDPNNGKWFKSGSVVTKSGHESWLNQQHQGNTDVNWVILHDIQGPIGAVSLYNIDWSAGTAEFGRFMIGRTSALGQGFGLIAIKMVLCIASVAGLKHVRLEVKPENERAAHLYKRAGFKVDDSSEMLCMSRSVIGYSEQVDAPY